MAWPEVRLQSWGEFEFKALQLVPTPQIPHKYFFRGQADSLWPLRPSLARILSPGKMTAEEVDKLQGDALNEFIEHMKSAKSGDGHYLTDLPQTNEDWIALMQHYRVPTRLLDWSFLPYVAAYFAVAEFGHWETDGAVWFFNELYLEPAVNANMYLQAAFGKTTLDAALGMYGSYVSRYPNPRINAQEGLFTWHRDININHDAFIDRCLGGVMTQVPGTAVAVNLNQVQEQYGKLIIPAELKPVFLQQLKIRHNITAKTVYTGLEGLGQFIAESTRLRLFQTKV